MDYSDIYLDTQSDRSSLYDIDDDTYNGIEVESMDEDDDDDDGDNFIEGEESVAPRREAPWDVISPDNIQRHQTEMLAEVAEVLACSLGMSRVLLTEYCWDKTQLLNDYVEKGREFVFRRSGCAITDCRALPEKSKDELMCECCFCPAKPEDGTAMSCGHWFCNDCWMGHLEVQIREGHSCRLKCIAYKCGCVCDEELVLRLLESRSDLMERYRRTLLESYVNDNHHVKWCPSIPNCGNAIRNNRDECCEPMCPCGLHFCFDCLSEAHSPCTCDMWTAWERKRVDDSETMNWITANTKKCPKCHKLVEKHGGCNLMTCRCGQYFCWLCGEATGFEHTYNSIANHQCGRWKDELDKNISEAASHHKRYMHYFTRWNGHRDSLRRESDAKEETISMLKCWSDALQRPVVEYNSLIGTVTVLLTARRVLSNSYVFAFFLCGKNWYANEVHPEQTSFNQPLFEDMQQQIEAEVERLSKLLSKTELETDQQKREHLNGVLNCARMVFRRLQNFYAGINSGLLGQLEQSVVSISDFMPHNLIV